MLAWIERVSGSSGDKAGSKTYHVWYFLSRPDVCRLDECSGVLVVGNRRWCWRGPVFLCSFTRASNFLDSLAPQQAHAGTVRALLENLRL
jgi:hypothetical protein